MDTLIFRIDIQAPKQKVWDVMLADKTYREWTGAFQEGSYYEGSWDKGSRIQFLALDDKGNPSGMLSKIAESIPYEYVSIEHVGEIKDGVEDTTSESAQQWVGAHENYTFKEESGVTTLTVELEGARISDEMRDMFHDI
jgi:hypothetical protein